MVPLQKNEALLLSSLEEESWPSEDKQNDHQSDFFTGKRNSNFQHSTIYGKTRQNFRPGAKDLPGHTNYTH